MELLPTDIFVDAVANRDKHYTVIFRDGEAISVQVNIRSYTGLCDYSHSRLLWQRGDPHISFTARCAINAAIRKMKDISKCSAS